MKRFLFFILSGISGTMIGREPWAWAYTKKFSSDGQHVHRKRDTLIVTKQKVACFTQLIFSWNAHRPLKGHFTFWIQGKDSQSGAWSQWHKMMSWGSCVQCSYLSNADAIAQHYHVRFEACPGKILNGFRIKILAHDGADLSLIRAITAAYADLTRFKPEESSMYANLASVTIKKVPRKSQFALKHPERHRLCSPTSCAMLIEYFFPQWCNMHTLAQNVFDQGLDTYGSWPFNMASAFELCQGMYWWRVLRLHDFGQLYTLLKKNCPVAVSVRGSLPGAPKVYNNGHLMVIIGYDAQTHSVICHDPAYEHDHSSVCKYPLADFLNAWEKSHRLAYYVVKNS